MQKMSTISRIVIALAALAVIATYFLPFWFIHLIAPQYPEGLTMYIWLNKLSGEVEIINGLNHYIGMAKINEDMFPELDVLVYIVGFFILFGLLVAAIGRLRWLTVYLVLIVVGAIAAMVDMYKWGYNYGHNLDPTAPIQVPGLSYQPPLIGHKKLLNFDAYSYPDSGGWVFIVATVIFFIVWFVEWRRGRKLKMAHHKPVRSVTAIVLGAVFASGCAAEPQAIAYGKDLCEECKMTIMDPKFGAEIVTKKGKAFKFDDAHCITKFLKTTKVKEEDIALTLFTNYVNGGFVPADKAQFVISPQLKSPMNSHAAAFGDKGAAEQVASTIKGRVLDWTTLYNSL
jgi:copper chaperone NosL